MRSAIAKRALPVLAGIISGASVLVTPAEAVQLPTQGRFVIQVAARPDTCLTTQVSDGDPGMSVYIGGSYCEQAESYWYDTKNSFIRRRADERQECLTAHMTFAGKYELAIDSCNSNYIDKFRPTKDKHIVMVSENSDGTEEELCLTAHQFERATLAACTADPDQNFNIKTS